MHVCLYSCTQNKLNEMSNVAFPVPPMLLYSHSGIVLLFQQLILLKQLITKVSQFERI